jgi:hypothetical protein
VSSAGIDDLQNYEKAIKKILKNTGISHLFFKVKEL